MPQTKSKAVPEGNNPVPHYDDFGSDHQPTRANLYQMIKYQFNPSDKQVDELTEKIRQQNQRLAGLEHEVRQSCPTAEADVEPNTKARRRTKDAAADRSKHGDKSSSARVDHDPMRLTSFGGDSTEPPDPEKSIGDAMVDEGTEAPKPYQTSTWSLGVVLRPPCVSPKCYAINITFYIIYHY